MKIQQNMAWCALLAAALALGCVGSTASNLGPGSDNARCIPNMAIACSCVGGATGAQVCQADGTYEPCRCGDGGTVALDARLTDDVASADAVSACPAGTQLVDGRCLSPDEIGGIGGALDECPRELRTPLVDSSTISCDYTCHGTRAPGIDYVAAIGTAVHAPVAGTVITAVNTAPNRPTETTAANGCANLGGSYGVCCGMGFGNHVVIRDRQSRLWYLGHMVRGSVVVTVGQVVRPGQPVGSLGNSGYTCARGGGSGAHVHLSVKVGGAWTDFARCITGAANGAAPLACVDRDLDTYGVGADCDAEDCDDNQPNYQSWNRAHTGCLGAEMGGGRCADRDGDGAEAGSECPVPDEDCDDFDPRVTTGCRRCSGAGCGMSMTTPRCGDGVCNGTDTCSSCPADCGACAARCGDGVCNGTDTCSSCPADCGACPASCGDRACNAGETCMTCPTDCGACAPRCGDGVCNGSESCSSCPADCGACAPRCGDGVCNGTDTCSSCPADCGACAPRCGDGVCHSSESCSSCPSDCGVCAPRCGDATCNGSESCSSCPSDCGTCPVSTCSCFSGNGSYCGGSAASMATARGCSIPVAAGNANNLLRCNNGTWTLQQTCTSGCTVAGAGTNDYCTAPLPTCTCFSGTGNYCGGNAASQAASRGCQIPVAAGNASNLLRCAGGVWTVQQVCSRGCYVAPPGVDDRCN